jgi:hypothetical protein
MAMDDVAMSAPATCTLVPGTLMFDDDMKEFSVLVLSCVDDDDFVIIETLHVDSRTSPNAKHKMHRFTKVSRWYWDHVMFP